MATKEELQAIIKNHNGGTWVSYESPVTIGTAKVYEIWTFNQDEPRLFWFEDNSGQKFRVTPQIRFVVEESGSKHYSEFFCDLADHLNKMKSAIAGPGDLTIGQLIRGLNVVQAWLVGTAIVGLIGGALALGAKLGPL